MSHLIQPMTCRLTLNRLQKVCLMAGRKTIKQRKLINIGEKELCTFLIKWIPGCQLTRQ